MRIEYHRTLIADRGRVEAFHEALRRLIIPGETVVVDIGTGTGLLAFLAAKLGAKKVYAYEMNEIGAVAQKLKSLNRLRNVELIAGRSTEILDPPRGDIVVTETLGNFALEEFPVEQFACPVIAPRLHEELTVWDRLDVGLDMSPARVMSLNNVYIRMSRADELLGKGRAAQVWDTVDFTVANRMARKGELRWAIEKPVTVYGLAIWWTASLAPGLPLSTSPLAAPTHWEQLFFPALEPLKLQKGDMLAAEIRTKSSEEAGTDIAWSLAAVAPKGKVHQRQSLSLAKGFLP
jgi:predicted RNA methylase